MDANLDLTGRRIGRYEIRSLLGRGGMGAVYRAYDANLDRHVAVKILPPHLVADSDRVRRFVQEAKSASALNHPHVVSIYEIGQEESMHYIAMELVEGATLRDRIGGSAMELKRALIVGHEIAEAIGAAHAAGVVHRDLKPENIIIASSGYVKVLDFGLAKLHRDSAEMVAPDAATHVQSTEPGKILGTVGYMSPEQAEGKQVDHRSDIFSLGCILYEMASGRSPFRGRSPVDTIHNIIHAEPAPLRTIVSDVPQELQRIIAKALAKSPEERYQSAKDLAVDLKRLLRELDSNTSLASDYGYTPSHSRRRRGIAIGAGMLAIIVAVLLVMRRPRETAPAPAAPAPLKMQRITASGNVIGACISPDGKYIAYVSSEQGQQSLWLRQLASRQDLQLVPPAQAGYWGHAFSPDGNSVYYAIKSRENATGALYVISTIGGRSRKILDGIDSIVSVSPDGKRLAFMRAGEKGASALVVANADGSGVRELMTRKPPEFFVPSFYTGPSWSPDGKRIAAALHTRETQQQNVSKIIEVDVATGAERVISGNWLVAHQVVWTPDGKELIAIGGREVRIEAQLWRVPYPSGEPRAMTSDLFDYRMASLTSDGSMLVTVAQDVDADLWLVPRAPEQPRKLRAGKAVGVAGFDVAPDGTIAYSSLDSGNFDLWITDAAGTNARQLTNDLSVSESPKFIANGSAVLFIDYGTKPSISRIATDGSDSRATTLYTAFAPDPPAVAPDETTIVFRRSSGLMKAPLAGGAEAQLTTYFATRPAISPDSTRVACYCQPVANGPLSLCIVPMSGGAPQQTLTAAGPHFTSMIEWTEDGRSLIVNTMPTDRRNLWQIPLDGSEPKQLTNFSDQTLFRFAFTPDRKGFVVSRGELTRDAMLITGFR